MGLQVAAPIEEKRFGTESPPDWQLTGKWTLSPDGAVAGEDCSADWTGKLPESCLVEMVFDLPDAEKLEQKAQASISVGPADDETHQLTASAEYQKVAGDKPSFPYSVSLSGAGADGQRVSTSTRADMRPAMISVVSGEDVRKEGVADGAKQHNAWAGRTISLAVTIDKGLCRVLSNGNVVGENVVDLPAKRVLSVAGDGITLRAVRILHGVPRKYAFLGGGGLAMLNGGESQAPSAGMVLGRAESAVVQIDGVPFVVQGAGEGRLAVMDVAAEQWKRASWSEGTGMPMAPLPHRWYSTAHLLLHLEDGADKTPAMGFGLRVLEMSGGDLKNIYVGEVPVRSCDAGVTVRPVPELGDGWFLASVPVNPAALMRLGSAAYFTRPWTVANGFPPRPHGQPSALRVAACTVEEAGIELSVQGNGLGNVYDELANPSLTGVLRNRTETTVTVAITSDLMPYERESSRRAFELRLEPGQEETFDALAAPITERGHYRVRVVADGGPAGRVDYRTNIGVLAPDTRKRINSPFGCWGRLSTDGSTDEQSHYLKVKAGVDFWMGINDQVIRMNAEVPDDAKAEEIVKSLRPDLRVLMLGWEHNWGRGHTFAFPRVIAEGQPEVLPDDKKEQADKTADAWRRVAKTVRKLRPEVKISLGNSAVNFSVPFLERGFKPGVEFDYFGTEEGIFSTSPEQPATAIGNTNWWAKAICEHFGLGEVPLFHSESVYFSTGPGFSRMSERTQAGYYVRTYLLGYPYNSVFGLAGALVDSSSRYIYSNWGASGYCNQAPECSPKLSYVAFATLTQLLDGAKYEGRLETGTTSVYALKFARRPANPVCVQWNLRGERNVTLKLKPLKGKDLSNLEVFDAINRPVAIAKDGDQASLIISELPIYVSGAEVTQIQPGANVEPTLPPRTLLSSLENVADWQVDTEPDTAFEAPGEWTGVPNVMGKFDVSYLPGVAPETGGNGAMVFQQKPLEGTHGLIPRYVSLRARPGTEVTIPKGTTRLGVWIRGNSTWAAVKFGVVNQRGQRRVLLNDKTFSFGRMMDNFDGWKFLDTGPLHDPDIQAGRCTVDRILVVMPQRQVYVDELLTTPKPEIAIWGLSAMNTRPPDVNYLPW